jgi:hypothetical protein
LGTFPPTTHSLYPCLYSLFSYISDAGSLTERENKKQVTDRIFFVNECEYIRERGRILKGEMEWEDCGGAQGGKLD